VKLIILVISILQHINLQFKELALDSGLRAETIIAPSQAYLVPREQLFRLVPILAIYSE
jgi:hypothetical protein